MGDRVGACEQRPRRPVCPAEQLDFRGEKAKWWRLGARAKTQLDCSPAKTNHSIDLSLSSHVQNKHPKSSGSMTVRMQ